MSGSGFKGNLQWAPVCNLNIRDLAIYVYIYNIYVHISEKAFNAQWCEDFYTGGKSEFYPNLNSRYFFLQKLEQT